MCGRCRQVFNAFQSLSRVEESLHANVTNLQEVEADDTPIDEMSPSLSATDMTMEPVADSLFLREEPMPLPAGFSASEPMSQGPSSSLPSDFSSNHSADSTPSGGAIEKGVEDSYYKTDDVAPTEPGIDLSTDDNPLLIEAPVRRETPVAASRAWSVGVFVLFIGLLVQAAYAFRTPLVSNYPQLRPTFSQLCDVMGCSLSWGRDEAALKIDDSDLIETPGKPGRILLTATLVNRGKTKQDLPSLQLRLTDNANQIVVSRLLYPGDYLGRAVAKDEGLVPDKELYINLNIDLDNKPLASGYGLLPFYP